MNENPIAQLIIRFQELVAQVPEFLQPVIIFLAGAVPFIEGEGASAIGIIGGLHPVLAALAGAAGNFVCVLIVVLVGARIRGAVVDRPGREPKLDAKPKSKGRERFGRLVTRFGVPGASILGPIALPTQFTAATFVASGVSVRWVLLWQAVAIVLWTALVTGIITGVIFFAT